MATGMVGVVLMMTAAIQMMKAVMTMIMIIAVRVSDFISFLINLFVNDWIDIFFLHFFTLHLVNALRCKFKNPHLVRLLILGLPAFYKADLQLHTIDNKTEN